MVSSMQDLVNDVGLSMGNFMAMVVLDHYWSFMNVYLKDMHVVSINFDVYVIQDANVTVEIDA